MRIMFGSAHPYWPQMFGGAQSSTHELVTQLRARGHEVCVLAGLTGEGWTGLRGRVLLKLGRRYARDTSLGYPVFRTWFAQEAIADVIRDFGVEVAVLQSRLPVELARAVDRRKVRTFIYLRNVETTDLGGSPGEIDNTGFIANSHFTAQHFARSDGISAAVVYPLIDRATYKVQGEGRNVTFINPHPRKGLAVALGVARLCPDIPFAFVRSWPLSEAEEAELQQGLATLPNVTLRPTTADMRSVYRHARIVLAPSQWEEAFGRIAAEAHVSGIPVVGSDRGGLPEAIGPGGLVVPHDAPPEIWAEAVRSLWDDADAHARASRAAHDHGLRPEMNADRQLDALLSLFARDPAESEGAPARSA